VPDYDAIVVGGGIGGLVAGTELARRGLRTVVLEAAPDPGGCVRFHHVGGLRLDRGADAFALTRPAVLDLVESLGLPVERPFGSAAWVRHEAGQAPLPAAALLGIPADPAAAAVRRVIGPAGVLRARADRLLPAAVGRASGLGGLVRRRMGGRVLRRLVEPVVGGVYSTDPDQLDVDAVAPGLRDALSRSGSLARAVAQLRGAAPPAGSAVAGLTGGMGTLTGALAAALTAAGGTLRCSAPVADLVRTGADGWAVTVGGADADRLTGSAVLLATPAGTTAGLLTRLGDDAPALPIAPASDVLLATVVVQAPALDAAPRGTGVLVSPRATGVTAKALTHATAKWSWLADAAGPGRHVLRLSYGRGGSLPPESAYPALALADAAKLLGVPRAGLELLDHALVRFPDQLRALRAGQRQQMDRFRHDLLRWPHLAVTGAAVAGTGLAGVVADARTSAARLALDCGRMGA
jgi:oxygen-dependent protoporphyrinogen oxidase